MKVAFDVDDTLIVPSVAQKHNGGRDTPNYDTIALYHWFQDQGYHMIVWSGSGVDWAKTWAEKLGLNPDEIAIKEFRQDIDICFDDCVVNLAKVNVRVKRVNNGISRADWNKEKHL